MGTKRLAWHVAFERFLRQRGSRCFEVRSEVPLSTEPPRIDYLLLRKIAIVEDDHPGTLRRLWPMLPKVSIVEYKSPSHPYRTGNLDRLWSYVHTYYADQRAMPGARADGPPIEPGREGVPDVSDRADLCAVLVVPARTPALLADAGEQGLTWIDLGDGYFRLEGHSFTLCVVELKTVGSAEGDDLLGSLGGARSRSIDVQRFWAEFRGSKEMEMSVEDMEGWAELKRQLLDSFSPEERLAGLAPAERLAGLDHDHQALALPLDVLRALPASWFATLSPEVQAELRRRLGQ